MPSGMMVEVQEQGRIVILQDIPLLKCLKIVTVEMLYKIFIKRVLQMENPQVILPAILLIQMIPTAIMIILFSLRQPIKKYLILQFSVWM